MSSKQIICLLQETITVSAHTFAHKHTSSCEKIEAIVKVSVGIHLYFYLAI